MFETRLPADCELLVWKAFFSNNVAPLLVKDIMRDVQEVKAHVVEHYCHDIVHAYHLDIQVRAQEWHRDLTKADILNRVLRLLNRIAGSM